MPLTRDRLRHIAHLADSGRQAPGARQPHLVGALQAAELAGLRFAFRARVLATVAIAIFLTIMVPMPRALYFLGVVVVFFLLGAIPYWLRKHRHAALIKGGFIVLDVLLLVAVTLLPSPVQPITWPMQTRLRFTDYLYLLVYLCGSALNYSPRIVVWTGLCIVVLWSAGFTWLLLQPDTYNFAKAAAEGRNVADPNVALAIFLDPKFVALGNLTNQVILTIIMTGLLAATVWRARRHLVRQVDAETARSSLSRYVSPDVALKLSAGGAGALGAPATRQVAVLFADIVGFTGLTERAKPDEVIALLSAFHARMCDVVFAHGGTLDKFIGDGLMATFGTLADEPDAAARALACAAALERAVAEPGWRPATFAGQEIRLGIGVHAGEAVVGNVGNARRLEFTVVGDTVNVASRLERLTRQHDVCIAVSGACLAAAGGPERAPLALEPRGPASIRGRQEPVELWVSAPRQGGIC
jgi:adenylate cyclase